MEVAPLAEPFGAVGERDCASSKDTSGVAALAAPAASGLGTGLRMTAPVSWLIGT